MSASREETESGPVEATVQEALARLEEYRNELTSLLRQQELLRMSLTEHERATQTLEEWDHLPQGSPLLTPVGAETFVKVQPDANQRVLISIGSGLAAEVERAKALEILNERKQGLTNAQREVSEQVQRVDSEAQMLSQQIEAVMRTPPAATRSPRP